MRSWPTVYLPPAGKDAQQSGRHPKLSLRDSYSGELIELSDPIFSSYVCGITPYDATHLGHAATYLTFDLIHRFQLAAGRALHYTQNITDIDDPLLERAKRDGQDWQELATSQIDLFREDMTELRVIPPSNYLGVVESMEIVLTHIAALMTSDKTYTIDGDIYLDLTAVPGAIENLPISVDEAIRIFSTRGGDPERVGKRHPLDTLIWSAARPGEPSWSSTFGSGRPGWHIECVAIALSTLSGKSWNPASARSAITLQGGGSDLRFPHHYMTSVQAQVITGKTFADLYVHTGMISWQGEKMSKSLGNLVFVSKLRSEGWSGNEIRWALIKRRYREDFDWQTSYLLSAREELSRINSALSREEVAPTEEVVREIQLALSRDLDVEGAIGAITGWCAATEAGKTGGSSGEISRAIDLYLGVAL